MGQTCLLELYRKHIKGCSTEPPMKDIIFQVEKAQHNIWKQSHQNIDFTSFLKTKQTNKANHTYTNNNYITHTHIHKFRNQDQRSKENKAMLLNFCRKIIFKLGKNKNMLRHSRFKKVHIPWIILPRSSQCLTPDMEDIANEEGMGRKKEEIQEKKCPL